MPFSRLKRETVLSKDQKVAMLREYYEHYHSLAVNAPESLNVKLPREIAESVLDRVAEGLADEAAKAARANGPLGEFLSRNPLPPPLHGLLPDEFRIFCLLLNALKQWVAAEQLATDRYLLGGTARDTCRGAATTCVVTGESLTRDDVQLHHPVRDGRPPLPVSKRGHAILENQVSSGNGDTVHALLLSIKREGRHSWVQLRRACHDLSGRSIQWSSSAVANTAKVFARKASRETGMTYEQLLVWLDEKRL